jgi:hypothetical protein
VNREEHQEEESGEPREEKRRVCLDSRVEMPVFRKIVR